MVTGTEVATSRLLASGAAGAAGALELGLFYPVDTVAKRLMNSKESFSSAEWRKVLLQGCEQSASASLARKLRAVFPGLSVGAAYKVTQRAYVWGGQPIVKDVLKRKCALHSRTSSTFCDGVAGAAMGIGEVALLPLNALKTKAQTNPEYQMKGVVSLCQQHGLRQLYAGWQWAMARNVPGAFALFGASAAVKDHVFGLEDHKDATFFQTTVASSAGCVSSILVACPLDVVKTRIQSGDHGSKGGIQIMKNIVQHEGVGAFFKGTLPKVVTVGPKLIFSFTIAQCLMARFNK